jgi:hypothetical protein
MSAWRFAAATSALFVAAAGVLASAAEPTVAVHVWARYWTIPPDFWQGTSAWTPPEKAALDARHLSDLGIAFSGGGTRSATATVGQLRGLRENGWLQHVRYITAVSGGSWAAVPFTYSDTDLDVLLGKVPPDRAALTRSLVETLGVQGSLARSIAQSKLFASGAREAARITARTQVEKRQIPAAISSLLSRYIGGRTSETYANLLATFFIRPFVPDALANRYTWNEQSLNDIKTLDGAASVSEFVRVAPDRPFLIVGGTAIYQHPAFDYPRLMPVEYTPLYTGIRQQYSDRLGGIYVTPYAYDASGVAEVLPDRVRVTMSPAARPFTLSNVIASSGAAPLLGLYRGAPLDALKRATAFFPSFNHFAVRTGAAGPEKRPIVASLLHGDGGFSDNLGIMPLLARQVHNIIVFVNGAEAFEDNPSIESMFWRLEKQEDFGGDRSMNGVFTPEKYWRVKDGLRDAIAKGGPAVYCEKNWDVLPNELYNIAGYGGLNICWVHNEAIGAWTTQLPEDTETLISRSRPFRNFPWFATFEQNKPNLIRLTPAQVYLLADLASWTVTSPAGRTAIENALGPALK